MAEGVMWGLIGIASSDDEPKAFGRGFTNDATLASKETRQYSDTVTGGTKRGTAQT